MNWSLADPVILVFMREKLILKIEDAKGFDCKNTNLT